MGRVHRLVCRRMPQGLRLIRVKHEDKICRAECYFPVCGCRPLTGSEGRGLGGFLKICTSPRAGRPLCRQTSGGARWWVSRQRRFTWSRASVLCSPRGSHSLRRTVGRRPHLSGLQGAAGVGRGPRAEPGWPARWGPAQQISVSVSAPSAPGTHLSPAYVAVPRPRSLEAGPS